jgi:hypothetical protein
LLNSSEREILDVIMGWQLIDLALLAGNLLKGKELAEFVKRSVEMIK